MRVRPSFPMGLGRVAAVLWGLLFALGMGERRVGAEPLVLVRGAPPARGLPGWKLQTADGRVVRADVGAVAVFGADAETAVIFSSRKLGASLFTVSLEDVPKVREYALPNVMALQLIDGPRPYLVVRDGHAFFVSKALADVRATYLFSVDLKTGTPHRWRVPGDPGNFYLYAAGDRLVIPGEKASVVFDPARGSFLSVGSTGAFPVGFVFVKGAGIFEVEPAGVVQRVADAEFGRVEDRPWETGHSLEQVWGASGGASTVVALGAVKDSKGRPQEKAEVLVLDVKERKVRSVAVLDVAASAPAAMFPGGELCVFDNGHQRYMRVRVAKEGQARVETVKMEVGAAPADTRVVGEAK